MGAFQSGFQMGGSLYNEAQNNALRQRQMDIAEQDAAMRKTDFDNRQADRTKQTAALGKFDALFQPKITAGLQLDTPTFGGGADVQAPGALSVQPQAAPVAAMPQQPTAGFQAPTMQLPTQAAAPTALQLAQANMGVAQAFRDPNGVAAAAQASRGALYEETLQRHRSEYKPEMLSELEPYINRSQRITLVNDGKKGSMPMLTVVDPGTGKGHGMSLSPQQQAELYAHIKASEEGFSDLSHAGIEKINAALAAAIKEENANAVGIQRGNVDALYKQGALENDSARTAANVAESRARAGLALSRAEMDRMGSMQLETGTDGNTYALVPTMTKSGLQIVRQQVNPDTVRFLQKGKGAAPKIEADGTYAPLPNGEVGVWQGGEVIHRDGGIPFDQRAAKLKAWGLDDPNLGLQWSAGRFVTLPGHSDVYDTARPQDLNILKGLVARSQVENRAAGERAAAARVIQGQPAGSVADPRMPAFAPRWDPRFDPTPAIDQFRDTSFLAAP